MSIKQVSVKGDRLVPAATMTNYEDLNDFEISFVVEHIRWDIASPRYDKNVDFRVQPFHECTVNIGYSLKH